jgi:cytochrome P450
VEAHGGGDRRGPAGKIDVVDTLVRRVTFTMLGDYLGVPDPPGGDLRVWGTRLFEFQFVDQGNDPELRKPRSTRSRRRCALHIQNEIAAARSNPGKDDVLSRCLALQAKRAMRPSATISSAPR